MPGRWLLLGLRGFGLREVGDSPQVYALFFSQLPLVLWAVLIPLLALPERTPCWVVGLGALLTGAVLYPVLGHWAWGGGWLAYLGLNLGLGHGFVDFAGLGVAGLTGAAVALAGIAVFGERRPHSPSDPAELPPVHLPLLAFLGALLFLVGWVALALGHPLSVGAAVMPELVVINGVLAASGGALVALLYGWFATGQGRPLLGGRGLAAGMIAMSAGAAFIPPWAALLVGAVAGLLLPLGLYATERGLRLDDAIAAVSTCGLSALWGLLAVGLFASGRYGAGWNGVGRQSYLGVTGQGVSGAFPAPGFQPDWPGQFQAQLIGLAAIVIWAFGLSGLVFKALRQLLLAWAEVQQARQATGEATAALSPVEDSIGDEETAALSAPTDELAPVDEDIIST